VPFSTTDVTYRALAEFETRFPTKLGDRLPNLHPLKPANFNFAIGTYTLTPFDTRPLGENAPSCYPEEVVEQGARKCLRFDAGSENVSADGQNGRFELRIDISNLVTTRTVERWTAALRTSSRVAGMSKVLPRCRCQTAGGSLAGSVSSASPAFAALSRSSGASRGRQRRTSQPRSAMPRARSDTCRHRPPGDWTVVARTRRLIAVPSLTSG